MWESFMYFNSIIANLHSNLGQSKYRKRCIICGEWFNTREIDGNKCPECVKEYKKERE